MSNIEHLVESLSHVGDHHTLLVAAAAALGWTGKRAQTIDLVFTEFSRRSSLIRERMASGGGRHATFPKDINLSIIYAVTEDEKQNAQYFSGYDHITTTTVECNHYEMINNPNVLNIIYSKFRGLSKTQIALN